MPKTRDYRKIHEKARERAEGTRWANLPTQVRRLAHYNLPWPYRQSPQWHPGDKSGTRATGTAKLPSMKHKVQTKIYPSDSGHHPVGPSVIPTYSPQHGGCSAAQPHGGTSPQAETGTRKHSATVDGNLEILGGIAQDEEEVRWARAEIERLYAEGFVDQKFGGRESRVFDGEEYIETTFGIEGLNFGTIDRLRFSADGNRAIVIDLKFGAWPVTLPGGRARGQGRKGGGNNLQLLNYAVYAFFLRYPMPHSVTVALIHVKTRKVYTHIYWRRQSYLLKAQVAKIIARVERAKSDPSSIGYYPNPVNCSWCERINCPARIDLAGSMLSLWSKKPIQLPTPELLNVSTEQLAILKTFVNALQRMIDAVNDECRRRAFDENDVIPGYEIKSRAGKRRIVGADNISTACNLVMAEWPKWFPQVPLDLSQVALDLSELGVDDLEQAAGKAAPRGKILRAKELVGQLLNNPALVNNHAVYYLAAKIPTTKDPIPVITDQAANAIIQAVPSEE